MRHKGEPADYLEMTCATLLQLEFDHQFIADQNTNSAQTQLKTAFSNPSVFVHIGPGEQTLESGHWWLKSDPVIEMTFSDRVELSILDILKPGVWVGLDEIEKMIRSQVPTHFGEIRDYIRHIAVSYADRNAEDSNLWKLKEKEDRDVRVHKVFELEDRIKTLGQSLNCQVEGSHPVVWHDGNNKAIYRFYIYHHTAFLGDLMQEDQTSAQRILVLPASRLDLLNYKTKEFPAMEKILSDNWHIVKFRLMSRLLQNPLVTLDSFASMIRTDPVENNPDQFLLF